MKTKKNSQPLVSVLTPVYNGERYLVECIESVLTQTYQNWEYVIVNNCSTDRTFEIAESFRKKDKRIRIHNNDKFLNVIQNFNNALRQISAESKHCKMVCADDFLFPECIERMVEVAEANPSVGIVDSYTLFGNEVLKDKLPYPSTVVSGREICRLSLLHGWSIFGNPTACLYSSELVRKRRAFYNESNLHADEEVCYDILKTCDFGFVHQILSYNRRHEEQMSSFASRCNTRIIGNLLIAINYGPVYLAKDEYQSFLKSAIKKYYRLIGRNIVQLRRKECREYHKEMLKNLGYKLNFSRLIASFVVELFFHPWRTLGERTLRRITACKGGSGPSKTGGANQPSFKIKGQS